jgi:predicted NACHT family NTPase
MIPEYLIAKCLDAAMQAGKTVLKDTRGKLSTTTPDLQEAINNHIRSIKNWSSEVSFSDLKKAKITTNVYVNLNIYLYPRRIRIGTRETIKKVPLKSIIENRPRHVILLGQPGAGKTTSMKYICQSLIQDDNFETVPFNFPILIKCRDLNNAPHSVVSSGPIIDGLYNILGILCELSNMPESSKPDIDKKFIKEKLILNILEELKVILILDGFDELMPEVRDSAIKEIRSLTNHLENSSVVVTSRTGDFPYDIEKASDYEISPLNQEQIFDFSNKWLNDEKKSRQFLKDIQKSPFSDTTIRPLTLAHLCAI